MEEVLNSEWLMKTVLPIDEDYGGVAVAFVDGINDVVVAGFVVIEFVVVIVAREYAVV